MSKTAIIKRVVALLQHIAKMSTAAKLLSPFFIFCCFPYVTAPLTGVIHCIFAFIAVLFPVLLIGQG